MNPLLTWQIEEHVEDGITAYLESVAVSGVTYRTGYTTLDYVEPGVYTHVEESTNVSEDAQFTGHRGMTANITIRTRADTASNEELLTSRQQHAQLRSQILAVLAKTELVELFNAQAGDHVRFDYANIENIIRTIDSDNQAFVSVIILGITARPYVAP